MDVADHHQVDDVSQGQAQTGDHGGEEDLADGDLCVRAHGDQHDGGRDQNAQGAAGAHHAAGQGGFVAAAQQHGERQHAHGDNGGAHDAGGGGEHGGNQDHGQTQSALQGPQQVTDGLKQAVRHLGVGQEVGHQHEHRDGHHGVALHLVVDLCHGDGDAGGTPGQPADDDAGAALHEGQLLAQDKAHDHQAEQAEDQRHAKRAGGDLSGCNQPLQLFQNRSHPCASFPFAEAVTSPSTCLRISETAWMASSTSPTNRQSFTGQVGAAHTE